MHFSKMLLSQNTKTQELFQIKGAKETQQLNASHELGFFFAMKDITETDGEIGVRSAD